VYKELRIGKIKSKEEKQMATRIFDEKALAKGYPIQPRDIDWEKDFLSIFSPTPTANAARTLGKLALEKGGWDPFTREEIRKFSGSLLFCGLSGGDTSSAEKLIVLGKDGKYRYTEEFIRLCHLASLTVK